MVSDSGDGSNWIGKYPALKSLVDALKHYRGILAATLLGAIGSAILIFFLSPDQLQLPAYEEQQTANTSYYPGGSDCRPEVLSNLARSKRAGEADRCRDAAEEYRLKQQDLIQQTRAANAAAAGVEVGSEMARMTLAGLIIGFLTVIAAGMAAWYARKAFVSADKQTTMQERQMHMLSRPFVYIDSMVFQKGGGDRERFVFNIKNIGASPAMRLRCETYVKFCYFPVSIADNHYSGSVVNIPVCAPNVIRQVFQTVEIPRDGEDDDDAAMAKYGMVCAGIKITFDTPFKKDKVIEEHRFCRLAVFEEGTFYLNTTIDDPDQPEFDIFDEEDGDWVPLSDEDYYEEGDEDFLEPPQSV